MAGRDPIDALICDSLNFVLRHSPTLSVRLHGPTLSVSSGIFVTLAVAALVLLGCGLWLGTWLYPTDALPPKAPVPSQK